MTHSLRSGQAHPTPPATIGQRVKLVAPSLTLVLRSPYGTVVREYQWGGYVVVKLDEPAVCHCWQGDLLDEVIEHPDNMEPA